MSVPSTLDATDAVDGAEWNKYAKKRIYQPRKIGVFRSIGFGSYSFISVSMTGLVGAWLLYFYTTFAGLTGVQAASIFAIGRIVDAVASLFMGRITDGLYKTKIGRRFGRRHLFLAAAAPLTLVSVLMWITGMSYWFYVFAYMVNIAVAYALQVPWETLVNEMTRDYNKRTLISTTRMVISGLGNMLTTFIPAQLFLLWPKTSPTPFLVTAIIFAAIAAVCAIITHRSTWERFITHEEAVAREKTTQDAITARGKETESTVVRTLRDYVSTFRIKSFRKHLGIYICSYVGVYMWTAVFVYYNVVVMGQSQSTSGYLQSLSIVSVPVTILAGWLITQMSPRKLWASALAGVVITSIGWAAVYAAHPANLFVYLFVLTLISQISIYVIYFVPWNIFPFIPDLDHLVTGENRAGTFAAVMTFVNQLAIAGASVLVGVLLDVGGLVTSKGGAIIQPDSAKHMIVGIISLAVGGFALIAMIIALTFKLNKKSYGVISDELKRLLGGGRTGDATPETKRVCQELTGVDYDSIRVWDNYVAPAEAPATPGTSS